jgi:hypothetical protein
MTRKEEIQQYIEKEYPHSIKQIHETARKCIEWADSHPANSYNTYELKIMALEERLALAVEALKKCDPSIHPVFVCNNIREKALSQIRGERD